jgi:hypothetical protein
MKDTSVAKHGHEIIIRHGSMRYTGCMHLPAISPREVGWIGGDHSMERSWRESPFGLPAASVRPSSLYRCIRDVITSSLDPEPIDYPDSFANGQSAVGLSAYRAYPTV